MINISKPIVGEEEIDAVVDVLKSGQLAEGQKVYEFEKMFADYCGVKYALMVSSGTAALHIALHSLGIGPGDEVITTPFTFVATANSILMVGAIPVFVDIDENTFNIDPKKIEEKITKKTKVILTVDLYGQPCDYDEIKKIAKKHNLFIVEDAAQAVGAEYKNIKAGALGDVGCFSLYATKNIMSGEGGVLTTDSQEIYEKAYRFRGHGQPPGTRYEYTDLGYNYHSTNIAGAIAIEQLKKIDFIISNRQNNAQSFFAKINNLNITKPQEISDIKHVYHQYTLKIKNNRDKFVEYLKENGIGSGVYYPKPLHYYDYFKSFGCEKGDLPVSEKVAEEVVSIPVHPSLNESEIDQIIEIINKYA